MSTVYLPFGQSSLLIVQVDEYQTPDGYWNLGLRCVGNELGDLHRFVYNQDTFYGIASPMDDVGVPIAPAVSDEGTSRTSEVLIRLSQDRAHLLREAREGVLAGLDEYIRSKILFRDHMTQAETYSFAEAV